MKAYTRLFEAKKAEKKEIDVDDYIDKLGEKNGSFVDLSLSSEDRKKLVKMHSSKQYNWKFVIHSTETDKEREKSNDKVKTLKKEGWKVFMDDNNIDQRALVFYKKK